MIVKAAADEKSLEAAESTETAGPCIDKSQFEVMAVLRRFNKSVDGNVLQCWVIRMLVCACVPPLPY